MPKNKNLTHDNVVIVRTQHKNESHVAVYDAGRLIHGGSRPVDHRFAANVWGTLEGMGYTALSGRNGRTTFERTADL